jgi:hypothetical protein
MLHYSQMQMGMQPPPLSPMGSLQAPLSPQPGMMAQQGMMFAPQSPQVLGNTLLTSQHSNPLFQFPPQ